jgi:hypothetical protein
MAGYFPGTGSEIQMGRARRALYNTGLGTQTLLRAELTAYYGYSSGQVAFSATLGGRYYPYTY